MSWSIDRRQIRTLYDCESKRLKQFELLNPHVQRYSLDIYPDELTAREADFRSEVRYGMCQAGGQQKLQIGEKNGAQYLHLTQENVAAALVMARGSAASISAVGARVAILKLK
jgi:hypothetical protein